MIKEQFESFKGLEELGYDNIFAYQEKDGFINLCYDVTKEYKSIMGDFVEKAGISIDCHKHEIFDRWISNEDFENSYFDSQYNSIIESLEDDSTELADSLVIKFTNGKVVEFHFSEYGSIDFIDLEDLEFARLNERTPVDNGLDF